MPTETTQGITIEVVTRYMPEHSSPLDKQFNFAYQVVIRNEREHPVQLISRFWEITPAAGPVKVVEGEGVIGQQPIIEPGNFHEYTSWCPLKTPMGRMQGHFIMQDLTTDDDFLAEIPSFELIYPPLLN